MINVSMGKHNAIDLSRVEKKLSVADEILLVTPLEETTIQQYFKTIVQGNQMRTSGHLACSPTEFDIH